MTVLLIAANALRRIGRRRSNLFFLFVLPMLLILVLGSTIAGVEPRIGVVTGADPTGLSDDFVDGLVAGGGAEIERLSDREEAVDRLRREDLTALVIVPDGYGQTLLDGGEADVEYLALPDQGGFDQQSLVQAVVADQNARIRAARLVADRTGLGSDEALAAAEDTAGSAATTGVSTVDADGKPYAEGSAFTAVAAQQLVLFLFLTGMIAAAALIESRRLGVTRRMLATPATTSQVVGGLMAGRFGISLVQGVFIAVATALLFSAAWGSWPASIAVIGAFSLVATAAAVLIGSLLDNENQSTAVGITLGLAFAAFGGCMVPLEVFPDGLRTAAHVTPHAWAVDAFTEVVQRGGGLADIATELAVLVSYAAGLLAVATVALRRTVTG